MHKLFETFMVCASILYRCLLLLDTYKQALSKTSDRTFPQTGLLEETLLLIFDDIGKKGVQLNDTDLY